MSDVLKEADKITEERGKKYGHPSINFKRIIGYWNLWLADKLNSPITEEDHAMMMVFVKQAREQHCPDPDNRLDMAGYTKAYDTVVIAKNCTRNGINGPGPYNDVPAIIDSAKYGTE